jgi:aspartate carbamoyltransferase catalytic subunit
MKDLFKFNVVNAGAGKFEHPSQSLLDLFTMEQELGTLENLNVTICGDIKNSRVAKSNISALKKFGAKVYLSGPEDLIPTEIPEHCQIMEIDQAIQNSDAVMFLRVQHERHTSSEVNTQTYNKLYGLNDQRIKLLKPHAIIMHPGPVNRDVEIATHLVEHKQSKIFEQMENGVYTRMAILEWIVS